ncbi:MAG: hypothetical protein Pars2KO_20650 [Parasphingorhabdus sp.]
MMKEALLFVASTGVLIYFLSPVSQEEKAIPEKIEEPERVPKPTQSVDDSWGYEDEDDTTDEDFVFGQPIVMGDDEDYEDENGDEAAREAGSDLSLANGEERQAAFVESVKSGNAHPDSPQGSQRGSSSNPIVFKTNNPENPADD